MEYDRNPEKQRLLRGIPVFLCINDLAQWWGGWQTECIKTVADVCAFVRMDERPDL